MPDLSTFAAVVAAMTCGAMLFFSFAVTPLVFMRLPAEIAAGFIRQVFPVYYLALGAVAGVAALLAAPRVEALALGAVAALFLVGRFALIPALDRPRGKDATAFARLHRLSVIVNAAQIIVLAASALRLAGA